MYWFYIPDNTNGQREKWMQEQGLLHPTSLEDMHTLHAKLQHRTLRREGRGNVKVNQKNNLFRINCAPTLHSEQWCLHSAGHPKAKQGG